MDRDNGGNAKNTLRTRGFPWVKEPSNASQSKTLKSSYPVKRFNDSRGLISKF